MASWWRGKVRQARRHVTGSVSLAERAAAATWLTAPQLALFDSMHPADRRHGLDVVAALRAGGHDEEDLLLAGLFHDASKGEGVRLRHRVTWSLGERYGPWILGAAAWLPGFRAAFRNLRDHSGESARLARAAGCSEATAGLIRQQARPGHTVEPRALDALRAADEAS